MKKIVLSALLLSYSTISLSSTGSQTGQVKEIVSVSTNIKSNADYVSLSVHYSSSSFSGLGCAKLLSDYLFRIQDNERGNQVFTQLLMSKQQGYTVQITVDDRLKDSEGFCYIQEIQTTPNETVRYRIK